MYCHKQSEILPTLLTEDMAVGDITVLQTAILFQTNFKEIILGLTSTKVFQRIMIIKKNMAARARGS